MIIMPKKYDWYKLLDKSWYVTKIVFGLAIICLLAYGYGTFKPNKWAKDKVNDDVENFYLKKIADLDLREPEFMYNNDIQFVRALHKCIDYINFTTPRMNRVPFEMIIGQAALETGWGTSRFATEGNNLFGIRTWNLKEKHIKPFDTNDQTFGIKVFNSKCSCVRYYIQILNNASAFKEFRKMRKKMIDNNYVNVLSLTQYISKFATDKDYVKKVQRTIKELRK